ncbi:DUF1842 domain-containing protein [Tenacibaculum jejuense]|uniref:DUF1842 domain-containing protein n=1 Tax=Tenacibaculum jejuense TaxID=584609 RepID=A0A238UC04_9FLAO|nr:DUF1842 domain-containing protein [Tenacibaculum jejuense]SNR16004.1 conserved protein of unknown function [Tenacibaculum jejuense]
MATLKEPKSLLDTSYLAKGTIGNVGMPGAPITHFSLVVSTEQGIVSGIVEITQAIDSPTIKVNVAGRLRHTGYGKVTQIVDLKGEYVVSMPPPAIGSYLEQFEAYLDVDNSWNGTGGFSFGFQKINNVPVTSAE